VSMLGAELVIDCLKNEGGEVVFGYPGSAVLTLYDVLYKTGFPHVLTGHEQGAVHAAEGYARATGKVGVCFATSGPGATNLITGIANAYMDSIPLVAITGQVGVALIGKDSFQEADICGITTPITKHNYLVKNVQELPSVLKEAFYIARTGRPGPVVVDIAKDVFNASLENCEYPKFVQLKGYTPRFDGDARAVELSVQALKQAKRPVIFVGGGVNLSGTAGILQTLVQMLGMPVVSSLMGLGCIPCNMPQYLGMVGMHGGYAANMAICECDLLLAMGVRFNDRVTGVVKDFASKAKIIQFDIDPAEVNKNVRTDLSVLGDLRWSLPLLVNKLGCYESSKWQQGISDWNDEVKRWKRERPLGYSPTGDRIRPQAVIGKVNELAPEDSIIVTDVGQHQMWTAQYYQFCNQRTFITSGGLGTMGFGLPAAIGAQLGLPAKKVILFTGDGSIMMNCQEIATLAELGLPIKIIVINNKALGLVSQWQRMFYGQRYSHSSTKRCVDLVKVAEGMGITGLRITTYEDLTSGIKQALEIDGPVLVGVLVSERENVLPMVPPGGRLDQMILSNG